MSKAGTTRKAQLGLRELIAMGVGGMIGGGIFSVMVLAAGVTGHALTPIAFALGGLLALIGGYSYVRLSLTFASDGASFTTRGFPSTTGSASKPVMRPAAGASPAT